jgi:hypothetical protein
MSKTVELFFGGQAAGKDPLGVGTPLDIQPQTVEEPVDWSNRGPAAKKPPTDARRPGERGKPVTTTGLSKSPSEEVSQTDEGGDLKDNPFNNGKKARKMNKKSGEGNEGEKYSPDAERDNVWVPAETTTEAFARWYRNTYGAIWRYTPREGA